MRIVLSSLFLVLSPPLFVLAQDRPKVAKPAFIEPGPALYQEWAIQKSPGTWEDALAKLTARIRDNPCDAHAYKLRGFVFSQQKLWGPAIEDFTESLRLCPIQADAYALRACAWLEGSLDEYECPEPTKIARNKTLETRFKTDFDRAIDDLDRAWRIDDKKASIYFLRASARLDHWIDTPLVTKACKVLAAEKKNVADASKSVDDAEKARDAAKKEGAAKKKLADAEKALKAAQAILKKAKQDAKPHVDKSMMNLREISTELEAALADYDQTIRLEPKALKCVSVYAERAQNLKDCVDRLLASLTELSRATQPPATWTAKKK